MSAAPIQLEPNPWSHPDLPFCIAAARRLGFRTIEVWGPLHPVAALDEAALRKLAALTRVRVPQRLPGDTPPGDPEAARQRLRLGAPGVEIAEYRPATADTGVPGAPPGRSTLFEAWGPLAVASACQPA